MIVTGFITSLLFNVAAVVLIPYVLVLPLLVVCERRSRRFRIATFTLFFYLIITGGAWNPMLLLAH